MGPAQALPQRRLVHGEIAPRPQVGQVAYILAGGQTLAAVESEDVDADPEMSLDLGRCSLQADQPPAARHAQFQDADPGHVQVLGQMRALHQPPGVGRPVFGPQRRPNGFHDGVELAIGEAILAEIGGGGVGASHLRARRAAR